MNRREDRLLFNDGDFSQYLDALRHKLVEEVKAVPADRLLNTSTDAMAAYLQEKYALVLPVLHEDQMAVDQQEIMLEVNDYGDRFRRPVLRVHVFLPFSGDKTFFTLRPSTYTFNPPRAMVREHELVFLFDTEDHQASHVQADLKRTLASVKEYLSWIGDALDRHNQGLPGVAESQVQARKDKLLKDHGFLAELGLPLRTRPDAPKTYAVPDVRRKVPQTLPPASAAPFKPEPTLPDDDYRRILGIINSMVSVIEHSPATFTTMGEEDLRQHFLVQLNGQYEGRATGETFNSAGKTDILIREGDRNIFIAECKFWKGPKAFTSTIDQLLGYTTWRDTKTAILLFNRNRNFSDVLAKIPELVRNHPNFLRELPRTSESTFHYVLHHPGDRNRELFIAVLAFEVPGT